MKNSIKLLSFSPNSETIKLNKIKPESYLLLFLLQCHSMVPPWKTHTQDPATMTDLWQTDARDNSPLLPICINGFA